MIIFTGNLVDKLYFGTLLHLGIRMEVKVGIYLGFSKYLTDHYSIIKNKDLNFSIYFGEILPCIETLLYGKSVVWQISAKSVNIQGWQIVDIYLL